MLAAPLVVHCDRRRIPPQRRVAAVVRVFRVFQKLFASNESLQLRASLHSESIVHFEFVGRIMRFLVKKSQKDKKSDDHNCVVFRNMGNLTPSSFLRGAQFAWGSPDL